MSTHRSDPQGWRLTPYEGHEDQAHWATFCKWVACGDRNDYAWVVVSPPLMPRETGVSTEIGKAIVAPRHQGVYLNRPIQQWPVHVYLLSVPVELEDADEVPPDAASIKAWALLDEKVNQGRKGCAQTATRFALGNGGEAIV